MNNFRADDSSRIGRSDSDNRISNSKSTKIGFVLFLGALFVRFIFLFVTPNNGADALARYMDAVDWLKNPTSLPSATSDFAWLPLHFWLLGLAIWIWKSQWSARILTALLGAFTLLPYWGATRRAFGYQVALPASVAFAIFGFHVGYSVTTSSEVPTIFFVTMGIYYWTRFHEEQTWSWILLSALFLNAACLCRFEPWLVPPVLAFSLLNYYHGWKLLWSDRPAWRNTLRFAVPALAGAIGWMLFSWVRWGDPMMLPHRTIAMNVSDVDLFRPGWSALLTFVPLELVGSLSPVIVLLAAIGLVLVFWRGSSSASGIGLVLVALLLFNYYFAIRFRGYQAKYTLMYCWLLLPFAFLALPWATAHLPIWTKRYAAWIVILFFVAWQAGVALGSVRLSPPFADNLTYISVTLPPRAELRKLDAWLKANRSTSDPVIIDDDNEGAYILQFSGIDSTMAFVVAGNGGRAPKSMAEISSFIKERRPKLLIASPVGPIGRMLSDRSQENPQIPSLGLQLRKMLSGDHWTVFAIEEPRQAH